MKLAIFGATGSIGTHLVQQALKAGYEVTAFVRNPEKLAPVQDKVRLVQGDVLTDFEQVKSAVAGQDAVLIALGAGAKGRVRAEGTRMILKAMEACGVRRVICQSTMGVGNSFANLDLKWKLLFRLPLRWALADHKTQEQLVRDSQLTWTIIRPSSFTDGPLTGNYRFGFPASERDLELKVSRADVAHFMLRQIDDERLAGQTVSLSC